MRPAETFKPEWAAALARYARTGRIELMIAPMDAFFMLGALQLALRHPALETTMKDELTEIARRLQFMITTVEPGLGELCQAGWRETSEEL